MYVVALQFIKLLIQDQLVVSECNNKHSSCYVVTFQQASTVFQYLKSCTIVSASSATNLQSSLPYCVTYENTYRCFRLKKNAEYEIERLSIFFWINQIKVALWECSGNHFHPFEIGFTLGSPLIKLSYPPLPALLTLHMGEHVFFVWQNT